MTGGQSICGNRMDKQEQCTEKNPEKAEGVQIHKMIKVFMQTQVLETWKGCGARQKSEGKKQPTHRVTANLKEGSPKRVW